MPLCWITIAMFLGLMSLSSALLAQVAQRKMPGVSRVKIEAVNESGAVVGCRLETFVESGTTRDLAKHFQGLEGIDIPYGTYDYTLRPWLPFGPTGSITSGRASISQPETVIVGFVPGVVRSDSAGIDMGIRAGFVIIGRVEPMPSQQEVGGSLRIRLSAIDGPNQLDVSVDTSGQFRLYAPLVGRYVLTIVRGADVLHSEILSFELWPRPTPLIIKLRERPPTVTRLKAQGKNP